MGTGLRHHSLAVAFSRLPQGFLQYATAKRGQPNRCRKCPHLLHRCKSQMNFVARSYQIQMDSHLQFLFKMPLQRTGQLSIFVRSAAVYPYTGFEWITS